MTTKTLCARTNKHHVTHTYIYQIYRNMFMPTITYGSTNGRKMTSIVLFRDILFSEFLTILSVGEKRYCAFNASNLFREFLCEGFGVCRLVRAARAPPKKALSRYSLLWWPGHEWLQKVFPDPNPPIQIEDLFSAQKIFDQKLGLIEDTWLCRYSKGSILATTKNLAIASDGRLSLENRCQLTIPKF